MYNPYAISRTELRNRKKFRCVHRHDGTLPNGHPKCYDQSNGLVERIGFLDIESTNLKSSFGIVLSYCILGNNNKLYKRIITPEELKSGKFDKPLLEQFCKDVRNFDRIITWYGFFFDVPFLRSRCDLYSLDFPIFKEILHTDAYFVCKKLYATLHSKRLGAVCQFFKIKAKGHPINPDIWLKCLSGDKEALSFVGDKHNYEDVCSLKEVWDKKLSRHVVLTKSSI